MFATLIAICISVGSAKVISFPNGNTFAVSVLPTPHSAGSQTAYLVGEGLRKPIEQVRDSDVKWFRRRDGSVMVLLNASVVPSPFTITSSGKVFFAESTVEPSQLAPKALRCRYRDN